jgi:hypothetical protein
MFQNAFRLFILYIYLLSIFKDTIFVLDYSVPDVC